MEDFRINETELYGAWKVYRKLFDTDGKIPDNTTGFHNHLMETSEGYNHLVTDMLSTYEGFAMDSKADMFCFILALADELEVKHDFGMVAD